MNARTRKKLETFWTLIDTATKTVDDVKTDLETLRDEERSAFDELTEPAQESDKGLRRLETVEQIEAAFEGIETAYDSLHEALECLDNAKGGE